jgi:hypothetical protein
VLVVSSGTLGGSGGVRGRAILAGAVLAVSFLAGSALLAGCAASSGSAPSTRASATSARASATSARASGSALAERVCGGAKQAAAKSFGSPLSERIVSPAAADLECVLTGRQVQVTVDSQAGPRAYTEFDTETSHQSQVFGNGGVNNPAEDPVQITVPGSQVAVWIPAQLLVVATDSTPSNGGAGAYVTVTVSGSAAPGQTALRLAEAAAAATFAAHPDGPA